MIGLTTNFFCLTRRERRVTDGRPGDSRTCLAHDQSLGRHPRGAEPCPGYNWSLAWSRSASGLTVWPGDGAWGGWDTGGRPCDRDMALGTMPSTAAGMPAGATPTTPGGYLLGEEGCMKPSWGAGQGAGVRFTLLTPWVQLARPVPGCVHWPEAIGTHL